MIITPKPVCTDPKAYAEVAYKHPKGINTLTDILSPPVEHSTHDGIVDIPKTLSLNDTDERQSELFALSYGFFRLSPLLEESLSSNSRPLSGELRGLGSYDLLITPIHFEIRDPAGKSAMLDPWDYGVHVPEMPEESEPPPWLNDTDRAALDLTLADIRSFRKSKAAVSIDELIKNPNGSAIPTLMLTHPSFALSMITADGWGIKSDDPDERMGTLNLIVHILDTTFEKIKNAKKLDHDFSKSILTIGLVSEILTDASNDADGRVGRNALILCNTTNLLAKSALKKHAELS